LYICKSANSIYLSYTFV